MLFTTPTQFAVLALLLVIGWIFGFASHPGGAKWRARYEEERRERAAERDALTTQLREAEARAATPVATAPVVARERARPATFAGGERRGWFDWQR